MSIKIFISDIHLSDTTTGDHNITSEMLKGFWRDIKGDIDNADGDAELIILGDFIDVIRSTEWKGDMQQWGDAGQIKHTVNSIVNNIINKNNAVFNGFKKYFSPNITYVIGNHDRMINSKCYDEIRKKIQNALGLQSTGEEFTSEYRVDNIPIYAAHGHQYDVYNKIENDTSPIGDAVVTLLINQYPVKVDEILYNHKVYEDLQEIDNLMPSTIAPYWIEHINEHIKVSLLPSKQNALKDTWNKLSDDFFSHKFVKDWFRIYNGWAPFDDADKLEVALRHFTETVVERVYKKYLEIKKDFVKERDQNAMEALKLIGKYNCDYILFGHTHESDVNLLDVEGSREKYYINTGTWRDRIVPGGYKKNGIVFGHQKSVDYVIFTIDDQNKQIKSFQLWNVTIK